eukprot:scaffold23068_cov27-Tisochrysis_lutea.AAC.3
MGSACAISVWKSNQRPHGYACRAGVEEEHICQPSPIPTSVFATAAPDELDVVDVTPQRSMASFFIRLSHSFAEGSRCLRDRRISINSAKLATAMPPSPSRGKPRWSAWSQSCSALKRCSAAGSSTSSPFSPTSKLLTSSMRDELSAVGITSCSKDQRAAVSTSAAGIGMRCGRVGRRVTSCWSGFLSFSDPVRPDAEWGEAFGIVASLVMEGERVADAFASAFIGALRRSNGNVACPRSGRDLRTNWTTASGSRCDGPRRSPLPYESAGAPKSLIDRSNSHTGCLMRHPLCHTHVRRRVVLAVAAPLGIKLDESGWRATLHGVGESSGGERVDGRVSRVQSVHRAAATPQPRARTRQQQQQRGRLGEGRHRAESRARESPRLANFQNIRTSEDENRSTP